jgi:hypothetical protein
MKRPRLEYQVAVYHRSAGAESGPVGAVEAGSPTP